MSDVGEQVSGRRAAALWRWFEPALFVAVLVTTILPRLGTLHLVFARGELQQWDGDSAYHLMRIRDAIARFPSMIRFDPAMAWPDGAACPWPDGFDYLAAAWGLLAGLGDPQRAELAVLLFTPILAVIGVWAAMDLARLVVPDGPAKSGAIAAAGLLTSVAPTTVYFSSVGFLDHHIVELISALLLCGWALRRFPGPSASWASSPWRWEAAGAAIATLSLWLFAGGVLYVALAVVLVAVALLAEERPRLAGSGAPALLAAAAVSALLAMPAVRAHGRVLSYQFPSYLQALLLAVAGAGLALAVAVARLARRPPVRLAVLLAAGLAAGAAGVFATAAGAQIRAGLSGWLLRTDPWIATIAEFQPLGARERSFWLALFSNFGSIGVCAPLILLGGTWVAARTARARGIAFAAFTAAFVLLTVNQIRFGRVGVPLLMIHLAAVLAAVAHRRHVPGTPALWTVRIFPALVAVVPVFTDPTLRPEARLTGGFPPWVAAGLGLRELSADDRGHGVLTQWDAGHLVAYTSGLPTVTNGFGAYLGEQGFREAESSFAGSPGALDALLARRRVRWVVAGGLTTPLADAVPGRQPFARLEDAKKILDLEYFRAFGNSPLVIGGSGIPGAGVRHLEHLMPVFATVQRPPRLEFPLPALWVYERVAGARLRGLAPAGARVLATLEFKEQARPHTWRAFCDAGADGRFDLVVPFPSGLVRATVTSAPSWSLRVDGGQPVAVDVPERAVRSGAVIEVGRVPPAPGATGPTRRVTGGATKAG
jgi:asparagine N-glycosylation enzyme membrane subunit Stt3